MTRPLLPALFVILTLVPPAVAGGTPHLTAAEIFEIRLHVPNADLSDLTPDQVRALSALLYNGEGFDLSYRIRSVLNDGRS
ncbi:MAG: hypothetical protein R3D63_17755 [Paracoccaceae bacterium]